MIRDGLDRRPLTGCARLCGNCAYACRHLLRDERVRAEGWQPIETAPIAALDFVVRHITISFTTYPNVIEGLTTHGHVVRARYFADGRYNDNWSNERGNIHYRLTHWRPLARESA